MAFAARKVVTVLFCDVVEFTSLGEDLDPERLRHVMTRFFGDMQSILERHGATVEKFIGDEVMAVFGVPTVHEDDALRAVRAAAAMMLRLDALNNELERNWGVRVQIRIGVNTGEVVTGDASRGHGFVTGDAVNLAKRLQTAAEPGQILIGKATHPLVAHAVEAGPLQTFKVKGKADPVASLHLTGVDATSDAFARHHDAPLVGRQTELAELRAALERVVRDGACELVTILGAPGIGKSRLVAELVTLAGDEARTLRGRCLPYGDGITFWPVVEIVRSLDGETGLREALEDAADGAEVAARLAAATGAEGGMPAVAEETFWALRRLLEELARERPLVLVLEDVHWGEETFLDLVEYLAARIRAPVLIVCLARADLLETRPEWAATPVLPLSALSDADSQLLLDSLSTTRSLSPEIRRRIADAAGGNPLFVEQMVAFAHDGGAPDSVPPTIQALLAERLDRVPPAERGVLERAAVAGMEFLPTAVVALSPAEERTGVGRALMALARKDLLAPAPAATGRDAFRFRHSLIRDAAYDGLPKQQRAHLHERFAVWLALTFPNRARELEEIIGYHLEQAYVYRRELGPIGAPERELARRAAQLIGAAGRRAFAAEDMPAAAKLLDRALRLLAPDDPSRLELLHELSASLWSTGDAARADEVLREVATGAKATGDRRLEWYARLDDAARRETTGSGADLRDVAENAILVFGEIDDDVGLARAWRRLALVHLREGRYADAEQAATFAFEHAMRVGDAREAARAADTLCTALVYGPTDVEAGIDRGRDLLERAGDNRMLSANVMGAMAPLEAMRGDLERARSLSAGARAVYLELGLPLAEAGLTMYTAMIELLARDPAAAELELRRGYELLPQGRLRGHWAALIAQTLAAQGRFAEAAALADEARTAVPVDDIRGRIAYCLARAALDSTDEESAAKAIELAERTDDPNLLAGALLAFTRVLVSNARDGEAADARIRAQRLYETKGNAVATATAGDPIFGAAPPGAATP